MGAAPLRWEVAAWVADLADNLLNEPMMASSLAARAVERLRWRARAITASVWIATDGHLVRALHAADASLRAAEPAVELVPGLTLDRLRQTGTIVCRFGELSGVEDLIPDGARSFIVAAATSRGIVTGALVLAWADPVPPCEEGAIRHLRLAAALLVRASRASDERFLLHDAVLGSLPDHIAVVNRHGIITEVNAAWTEFARRHAIGSLDALGPGVSYPDVCRRAAASGCLEARAAMEGIEAVCSGASPRFQTVYACHTPDEERWCTMTVAPLPHPNGGAVIVHADITAQKVIELAERHSEALFHRVADAVPLPIWIMTADGRLTYGNQRWMDPLGGTSGNSEWTNAFHPEDRAEAASALHEAVSRRQGFELELRLKDADGAYRWSTCLAAPRHRPDGGLESFVGCCCDISAKRRAESAFNRIAAKLVAAQEAERSRIARELHDDLGQQVALLASKLEMGRDDDTRSRDRMRMTLAEVREGLQRLATSIHSLSHDLHPAKVELLGLAQTMEALCRDIGEESGVHVRFAADGVLSHVDEDTALCVFRVAQEALRNAVKHSGARNYEVEIHATPTQLVLRIADDGGGFDPLVSPSAGIGLVTMRERVELIGGVLTVETELARGTTIEISVPTIHTAPMPDAVTGPDAFGPRPVRVPAAAMRSASSVRGPR